MMWTTIGLVLIAAAAVTRVLGTPGSSRRILGAVLMVAGGAALLLARAQPIAQARHLDQQRRAVCVGMADKIRHFARMFDQWHIAKYSHVDRLPPELQSTMNDPEDRAQAQAYYDNFNSSGLGYYCIANFPDCREQITEWSTSRRAPFLAHLDTLARAYEAGVFDPCTPRRAPGTPPQQPAP